MTYLDQHIINLTSASAQRKNNGTMLSFVEYEFIGLLREEPNIVHAEISLISAEIPVSFYTINNTNHALEYEISFVIKTIIVPNGNYNGNSLIDVLDAAFLANGDTITVIINQTNGVLTFSTTTALWSIRQSSNSIIAVLGFEIGTTTYNSTALSPFTITPPHPLNLLGAKRISVCSNDLPIYSYSSLSNNLSNILATVEINVPAFGLIFYKNTTLIKSKLRVSALDSFDIQLKDEFGNLLDFNNAPWSITLGLFITRDLSSKMIADNSFWKGLKEAASASNDTIKQQVQPAEAPAEAEQPAEEAQSLGKEAQDPEFEILTS